MQTKAAIEAGEAATEAGAAPIAGVRLLLQLMLMHAIGYDLAVRWLLALITSTFCGGSATLVCVRV